MALPRVADAAVPTKAITVAPPYQPPTLSPETPVVDTEPYLHTASIAYDDVAGTVTGTFSLYDPQFWANQSADRFYGYWTLTITLADACSGPTTELTFVTSPAPGTNSTSQAASARATLTGYQGSVDGTGPFDGTNYSTTLQSPAFAHLNLRCVEFSAFDNYDQSDGANNYDSGAQWLNGYAPLPTLLNPWTGKFRVRPREIGLSGDGSSFMAGAKQHGRQSRSNPGWAGRIAWSSWTATQAIGSGANWQDDCRPDCASGHYHAHPAKLRAYDPQNGYFTRVRMRLRYRGRWHTFTLKLGHAGAAWYWG